MNHNFFLASEPSLRLSASSLNLKVKPLCLKRRSISKSSSPLGFREKTGEGKPWKAKPMAVRGPERELPLLKQPTPMHSSAKRPGLPGESRDERLNSHSDGADPNTQTHTQRHYIHPDTDAPCSSVSSLAHCSVSQDGFWAVVPSGEHMQACKAQLIDLLGFRGRGRRDIRCSLEIIEREQRARTEEQRERNSRVLCQVSPNWQWDKSAQLLSVFFRSLGFSFIMLQFIFRDNIWCVGIKANSYYKWCASVFTGKNKKIKKKPSESSFPGMEFPFPSLSMDSRWQYSVGWSVRSCGCKHPNLETTCWAFSLRTVSDFMDHWNFYSYISFVLQDF